MANTTPYLYYRKNGVQTTIEGALASSTKIDHGLSLCWRHKSGTYACARMVRKGSAYADSDLCIRHNGIDYVVRKNNETIACRILDDFGREYEYGSVSIDATGWRFGDGINPKKENTSFVIDANEPWTVAFKVKGTSETGSPYPSHILHLSSTGEWTPKKNLQPANFSLSACFQAGNLCSVIISSTSAPTAP